MKASRNDALRHNFAIWVMGRKPGWFKAQRYLYRCLRCKWAFMVNDAHSGSVRTAGDEQLTPSEDRHRLDSFVAGPCPGYMPATEAIEHSNVIALNRENRVIKRERNARAM